MDKIFRTAALGGALALSACGDASEREPRQICSIFRSAEENGRAMYTYQETLGPLPSMEDLPDQPTVVYGSNSRLSGLNGDKLDVLIALIEERNRPMRTCSEADWDASRDLYWSEEFRPER